VQSKPKTVMDEIVPIQDIRLPKTPPAGVSKQPQYFSLGDRVQADADDRLEEGPPTTNQMVADNIDFQGFDEKYENLTPKEKDQIEDFFYEYQKKRKEDYFKRMMPEDPLKDTLKQIYESQFPEKLMAQYNKNMSGGIMADGKPKEKSSVELLAEYDYKIG